MISPTQETARTGAQPAWDVARLFPNQGEWTEEEFIGLTDSANQFVEFTDGSIEVLAMPKRSHQRMVAFIYGLMLSFVSARGLGELNFGPLRVRLRKGMIREPDIIFMLDEHADRANEDVFDGADLVVEVVSPDAESRRRDLQRKRREYAQGGVPEYWIVDPQQKTVTVLTLEKSAYKVAGEYVAGQRAKSVLLKGFAIEVSRIWEAAKPQRARKA